MIAHSVLAAVPMVIVAGLLFLLGSRLRAGDLHMVAGYDPKRVNDKAGLAQLFSRVVTVLGSAALVAAIIQAVWPAFGYWAVVGFGAVGIVAILALFLARGRYDATSSRPPASGSRGAPLPPNDR